MRPQRPGERSSSPVTSRPHGTVVAIGQCGRTRCHHPAGPARSGARGVTPSTTASPWAPLGLTGTHRSTGHTGARPGPARSALRAGLVGKRRAARRPGPWATRAHARRVAVRARGAWQTRGRSCGHWAGWPFPLSTSSPPASPTGEAIARGLRHASPMSTRPSTRRPRQTSSRTGLSGGWSAPACGHRVRPQRGLRADRRGTAGAPWGRRPRQVWPSRALASHAPAAGGSAVRTRSAQGGLHQGPVPLAQDMWQRGGAGGLVTRHAQGPHALRTVTPAPVGDHTVTPVATPPGHPHAREHGGQGMPPPTRVARVRPVRSGRAQGTALGCHDLTSRGGVSRRDPTPTSPTSREVKDPGAILRLLPAFRQSAILSSKAARAKA